MNIQQYNFKQIVLIDIDGKKYKGKGKYITSGDNDDLGEQLELYNTPEGRVYEFYPNEIKSIEIIEG